jgi:hypothetical protein
MKRLLAATFCQPQGAGGMAKAAPTSLYALL